MLRLAELAEFLSISIYEKHTFGWLPLRDPKDEDG